MPGRPAPLALTLVLAMIFSGCLGGEDVNPEKGQEGAAAARATGETGAITGQIVTVDLEVLVGIGVGLSNRTGGVELTSTDTTGRYTFNDLSPGPYRIEITDACCEVRTANVVVAAGEVSEVNLKLERLSSADLRLPRVISKDWSGFLSCGFAIGGQSSEYCGESDENQELTHEFTVLEGLSEIVIGMDWVPSAQTVGGDMRLELFSNNKDCERCNTRYFVQGGPPPLIIHVTDDQTVRDGFRFSQINGTQDVRYRAAMHGVSVGYQQEFTLYWHEFYNQAPPPGFNPIPDG